MDFKSIYYVSEGFARGAFRATEVGDVLGGHDIALTCGDWMPPKLLRFRQYEGRKLLDFVGTQRANVDFFSDRVISALRETKATGWDTYPIRLEAKDGSEVMGYHGLVVRGRCGPIDNSRSVQVEKLIVGNPKGHAPAWKGLYFAEQSWDGSDIFRPANTGYIFVTQKVRNALEQANVTNFSLTSLAEFERLVLF